MKITSICSKTFTRGRRKDIERQLQSVLRYTQTLKEKQHSQLQSFLRYTQTQKFIFLIYRRTLEGKIFLTEEIFVIFNYANEPLQKTEVLHGTIRRYSNKESEISVVLNTVEKYFGTICCLK